MKVHFFSNLDKRLAPVYELSVYRIIQELTNNAVKHSGADNYSIQLLDHQDSLLLTVEDNGKGWDMSNPDLMTKGIGLRNIKGRVKALGGTLIFDTQPGKGLSTIIEFPHTSNEYEKP
jgi:signal transduction histidine kinase